MYQYFCELGAEVLVKRNDELTLEEIATLAPEKIVISPGPCTPDESGISWPSSGIMPGRCRCWASAWGIRLSPRSRGDHRPCRQSHARKNLPHQPRRTWRVSGIKQSLTVTRYHSLVIDPDTLPECFDVTARSESGEIMAIRHREWDLEGVQFHPESILSEQGHQLLANFLKR
ncbi:Para-aminobenzoate synthase glutamine amidotransferase component II [Raoultella terrigena]|uniref:Para-aminobenzoate synthase glutamine amidotransferase component II n=1 Tax=Raoultella terrigena TaxID=577 RepID=A0A4U9D3E0_RAOTE|nr:Para-aminobenzoate synthase glutamine amidotransferase component II [Raoultella terrigena]